ncbi:hypothetical protein KCP75_25655 [Salmonella enterica subsp. enterica]|nr:hypothetical protein KCP75_25655 [Salmonella enterica subsp. enterica]
MTSPDWALEYAATAAKRGVSVLAFMAWRMCCNYAVGATAAKAGFSDYGLHRNLNRTTDGVFSRRLWSGRRVRPSPEKLERDRAGAGSILATAKVAGGSPTPDG